MITAFQSRVYTALCSVPRGRVTTYASLASAVGCRSPRAVGQALKRNPLAPSVPCHRVIASDSSIGGFRGFRSGKAIAEKIKMLAEEGVIFRDGKLADAGRLFKCT